MVLVPLGEEHPAVLVELVAGGAEPLPVRILLGLRQARRLALLGLPAIEQLRHPLLSRLPMLLLSRDRRQLLGLGDDLLTDCEVGLHSDFGLCLLRLAQLFDALRGLLQHVPQCSDVPHPVRCLQLFLQRLVALTQRLRGVCTRGDTGPQEQCSVVEVVELPREVLQRLIGIGFRVLADIAGAVGGGPLGGRPLGGRLLSGCPLLGCLLWGKAGLCVDMPLSVDAGERAGFFHARFVVTWLRSGTHSHQGTVQSAPCVRIYAVVAIR